MISRAMKDMIDSYVQAYNTFDIEGMMSFLHDDITFRNIASGEITAETQGIQHFRELAQQSAAMFATRCQTITGYNWNDDCIEVGIMYKGTFAVDLPNGYKSGDQLELNGTSKFKISDDKIILIEDYS
ncbi:MULTISPECIES: nuclear transport factor 2 family protein [Paenibacillus]|uniref:nuclear transport factor 2 family protein n=1 Tax=Paenibacillus TaxID=44249 RepID=UPI0003675E37|nr:MULTISPECIES: nuclear transport factor 2 family protein [Paenibacillus]